MDASNSNELNIPTLGKMPPGAPVEKLHQPGTDWWTLNLVWSLTIWNVEMSASSDALLFTFSVTEVGTVLLEVGTAPLEVGTAPLLTFPKHSRYRRQGDLFARVLLHRSLLLFALLCLPLACEETPQDKKIAGTRRQKYLWT